MSAFEAVRVLLRMKSQYPNENIESLRFLAQRWEQDATSLDFQGGFQLYKYFEEDATGATDIGFYQRCVEQVILNGRPAWTKMITLGRERFLEQLTRDEIQCFRLAGLLDIPASKDTIDWWDRFSALVRAESDDNRTKQGRGAELLTLKVEKHRLERLSIQRTPELVSFEDNTAGYDVLSFDAGEVQPISRLIEVKSTTRLPLRFFLPRNEWEQAKRFMGSYYFYIWYVGASTPRLLIKSVNDISDSIPEDNGTGTWTNVEITIPNADFISDPFNF